MVGTGASASAPAVHVVPKGGLLLLVLLPALGSLPPGQLAAWSVRGLVQVMGVLLPGLAAWYPGVAPLWPPLWRLGLLLMLPMTLGQPAESLGAPLVPRVVVFPTIRALGGGRLVGFVTGEALLCRVGLAAHAAPNDVAAEMVEPLALEASNRFTLVGVPQQPRSR